MTHNDIYFTINEIFVKHNIPIQLKEYFDLNIHKNPKCIVWNRTDLSKPQPVNKISDYLQEYIFKTAETNHKTYFHYLRKIDHLEDILKTGKIRLYNLNKFLVKGDNTEYRYFLESFGIDFPNFEDQISKFKDGTFIWCLTDKRNSKKHWEEYADNFNGVAISIEFENRLLKDNIIEIVPVCYDIPFLKEIQEELKAKFDKPLYITGYLSFAKYYKEKKYEWESETRLCFDKSFNLINDLIDEGNGYPESDKKERDELFSDQIDEENNKYILASLNNTFFQIQIREIFCTKEQHKILKPFLKDKNIQIQEKKKIASFSLGSHSVKISKFG